MPASKSGCTSFTSATPSKKRPSSDSAARLDVRRRLSAGGAATSGAAPPEAAAAVAQLKTWAVDLAGRQQGAEDALLPVVQSSVGDEYLRHCDEEVRLWSARCAVEALRIFAPEPPLDADRLQLVMELLLDQVASLADDAAEERVALLSRIQVFRIFMCMFECEAPDALIGELVSRSFAVVRAVGSADEPLGRLVGDVVADVLAEAEATAVPEAAVGALVAELTPRRQAACTRDLARRVAGRLARRSAARAINDFLSAALYAQWPKGRKAEAAGVALEAFEAVYELYAIDPALVAHVLPNLEGDLQCADLERRCLATRLVGRLLAHRATAAPAQAPLVATHPMLLDRFAARLADAEAQVRQAALDGSALLLVSATETHGSRRDEATPRQDALLGPRTIEEAAHSILDCLNQRCLDPVEAVRMRAVEILADAAMSPEGLALVAEVLPAALRRVTDRKAKVRELAAVKIAEVYARHGLRAWAEGRHAAGLALAWAPRLLCEAYGLFLSGRLGFTAQLEELIERDVLGCGALFQARERALTFLGLVTSIADFEPALKGLRMLLARKRDAAAALWHFLQLRTARAAPLLAPGSVGPVDALVATAAEGSPSDGTVEVRKQQDARETEAAINTLARFSPEAEAQPASASPDLESLRALDAVRDKSLFAQLAMLCAPRPSATTEALPALLRELDRIMRVHSLTELAPLLRRAIFATWLLSDQVEVWLDLWTTENASGEVQAPAGAVRRLFEELPEFLPGAFWPHAQAIVTHLSDAEECDTQAALQSLAILGEVARTEQGGTDTESALEGGAKVAEAVLRTVRKLAGGGDVCDMQAEEVTAARGEVCRRAMAVLHLLDAAQRRSAIDVVLSEAARQRDTPNARKGNDAAVAWHLVAAVAGQAQELFGDADRELLTKKWLPLAERSLDSEGEADNMRCAIAEAHLLLGGEAAALTLTDAALPLPAASARFPLHVAICVLRGLGGGTLPSTTALLTRLGELVSALLGPSPALAALTGPDPVHSNASGAAAVVEAVSSPRAALRAHEATTARRAEELMAALQESQRSRRADGVRLADRLRLGTTLAALAARAPGRLQREAGLRLLRSVLLRALRHRDVRQEPLVEYAVACFLHFLSRLRVFAGEAEAATSAFPESTKLAFFFVDALMRCDPAQSQAQASDLAASALAVCERARYFVDREAPDSKHVHKAAFVLRYVIERRCPELGAQAGASFSRSSDRGAMPRELFELQPQRGVIGDDGGSFSPSLPLQACASAATSPADVRSLRPPAAGA